MKALVYHGPLDLRVEERPDVALGARDVRIDIVASGICGSDLHAVLAATPRRRAGTVMGHEVAGRVAEVGADVRACALGDRVAVQPLTHCGECPLCQAGRTNVCEARTLYGMTDGMPGGYAERIVVTEDRVFPVANGADLALTTLAEPLAVALHAIGRGPATPARSVAVVGCGTIGLMTLVALSTLDVETLFVVDTAEAKLEYAKPFGAHTLVAGRDDVMAGIREATGGRGVDWAIEAVGISATAAQAVELAGAGGHITWIGNAEPIVEVGMQNIVVGEKTVAGSYGYTDADVVRALELVADGRVPADWLSERTVSLDTAPEDFVALARGEWPCVKAVLTP
ncbi:alcohol dehydrogenase catalytic domain-containing protein [bacterium]|nr:alcohol dehydrogenase catalytic domain-containing protein [bacterium]